MNLHPTKSQYLTVNNNDEAPLNIQDVAISKTKKYVYLGALISNQPTAAQVKDHITSKAANVRKFLMKNNECPYTINSCETWLTNDLRSVETPYNNTLKQMLLVHQTTCNDLVYLETGHTNAKSMVVDKQMKFLREIKIKNSYVNVNLAISTKSPMGKRISTLPNYNTSQRSLFMKNLNKSVALSESSRRST